ncbi:DUF3592 domain-containing protein [Frankia sp. CcI49]|uniref:DUF3592 domain-containing protein n=1 Tax=Frankia sp. CcI49 TaxID=1745382 RepID=UPI001055999D|nr:DUF3592 domain-containing protein [Frankia sp. CcI49]
MEFFGSPPGSVLAILFGIAVLVTTSRAFRLYFEMRRLRRRGFVAEALVVGVDVERDTDSVACTPWVSFVTGAGERRVVKACSSVGRELAVGSLVTVVYRPGDPSHAAVPDRRDLLLVAATSPLAVGLGLVLIGTGLMGLGDAVGLPVPELSFLDPPDDLDAPPILTVLPASY